MTQPPFDSSGYSAPSKPPPGYPPPAYTARPMTADDERTVGMLAHLVPLIAMVFSGGLLGFVASLVIYLVYKDRGPFVRENAVNSLNVQIITGIMLVISVVLMLVLIGFVTYPLALLFAFVVHIIGAMKANRGEWWKPPMTPRFVH
ncbi:DUF4870 domain-containing protein [Smaragdicoccus niigatensis]|uniref:DUF4870 domain-containing protein n=1 Tax=Smaragdicoccus niigatensis TaxID=359359 RepID=UPI000371ECC9|nr:DUF4870 domain-containing protein [Smaragdicoccus niigatensis]